MCRTLKRVVVFFAWQSNLPQSSTTNAIKAALNMAKADLFTSQVADIDIITATSNSSGGMNIPFNLAENIRISNIFVCDITPVARLPGPSDSLPNPNVTIELGMAAVHLGWERVVMLLNKAHAVFEAMPFDFDRQRIFDYTLTEGQATSKGGLGAITGLVKSALIEIIEKDPKRPRELEGRSPDEVKRVRDVENIKWFMRHLSTTVIDRHIEEMPDYLSKEPISVFEGINEILHRTDFHLYDQEVYAEMVALKNSLEKSLAFDEHYYDLPGGTRQRFERGSGGIGFTPAEQEARQKISYARIGMREHLNKLVKLIRDRFVDIDINETNELFEKSLQKIDASFDS